MGKVTMNWLTTGHSGRACKADSVYTKINRQTHQVTSSKLCNPYQGEASSLQIQHRSRFGIVSKACQEFIKKGKAQPTAEFNEIVKAYKAQHKCGSLLGYLMQKITDTRVGKTELEHRAIVKGWVTIDESGTDPGTQNPSNPGTQTPTNPGSGDDSEQTL